MSGADALRKLAEANVDNAKDYFRAQIDDLSRAAASASSTYSMASADELIAICDPFIDNLSGYLEDFSKRLTRGLHVSETARLTACLAPEKAYLNGYLDGGGVPLAIQAAFPEGDWDDTTEVKRVLRQKLAFLDRRFAKAVEAWISTYEEHKAEAPAPKKKAPRVASAGPGPVTTRIDALMTVASNMGVRIKTVPKAPSDSWMDKLEAKLRQVADKKKLPFELPTWGDIPDDDDHTAQETAQERVASDPAAEAARKERIEKMLAKAERAELKLGRVPDVPTDAWIEETEAKLKTALEKRKKKRKAERERKTKQRKERVERLQRNAGGVGIDLGRIPPFPTEDWIARSEMRVATQMLKEHTVNQDQDQGRAERLRSLLTNAAQLGVDLDVPPDPDAEWLEWAEDQVKEAERSEELLAGGEEEVVHETPMVYYEEGTIQEQAWPLEGDTLSIGRTRKNDVSLPHDGEISRNHCVIKLVDDQWMIEDLNSTRGTLVDDIKIKEPIKLVDGATILVGETLLVFRHST